MGTRLEAGDRPLIEIPAPTPRFGGSLGPHFLEKHEENRGFQVKTGIFFDSAIFQGVVVGSTSSYLVRYGCHLKTLVR